MILPYFLSLRRSLSHTLPKHALSLSLRAILSLSPFHSSTLSLSLSVLYVFMYQYYLIDILIHVLNIVANI